MSEMTRKEFEQYLIGRMPQKLLDGLKDKSDYEFDQIFAEAVHRHENGERIPYFSTIFDEMQRKRNVG